MTCSRCKKEIKPNEYSRCLNGIGCVCHSCEAILIGDDDYRDVYTGEKLL